MIETTTSQETGTAASQKERPDNSVTILRIISNLAQKRYRDEARIILHGGKTASLISQDGANNPDYAAQQALTKAIQVDRRFKELIRELQDNGVELPPTSTVIAALYGQGADSNGAGHYIKVFTTSSPPRLDSYTLTMSEGWNNIGERHILSQAFDLTYDRRRLLHTTVDEIREAAYAGYIKHREGKGEEREGREQSKKYMEENLAVLSEGLPKALAQPPEQRTLGWRKFLNYIQNLPILKNMSADELVAILNREEQAVERLHNLLEHLNSADDDNHPTQEIDPQSQLDVTGVNLNHHEEPVTTVVTEAEQTPSSPTPHTLTISPDHAEYLEDLENLGTDKKRRNCKKTPDKKTKKKTSKAKK